MQTEDFLKNPLGIGVDAAELKNHYIAYIRKADEMQRQIQGTQDEIKCLSRFVDDQISIMVEKCHDVETLAALCDSFGLDNKGYQWAWEKAYKNSYEVDTDPELAQWHHVQFSVTIELEQHIRKLARE
jgi:hypothetical protein